MQADNNDRKLVEQMIHESEVGPYAYDSAVIDDLRFRLKRKDGTSFVSKTIQFSSPEDDLELQALLNEDNIVLPFISLQRVGWSLNLDRQGDQTFIGEKIGTIVDEDKGIRSEIRAQVIPITINWRMRVYTADMITADALIREILFYYHLHPTLLVNVPHGLNIKHRFNIYFNSDIENNSDIDNFKTNGTRYRHDLSFYSDDAYLWKARWDDKVTIYPEFIFKDGSEILE